MRSPVFGNDFFDQWLNQKSNEILAKVEKDKISNEDMMILSLKAQVNHFHHMDIEFRDEFKSIDLRFEQVQRQFDRVDERFEQVQKQVDKRFEQVDKRFEQVQKQVDKRFDHLTRILMWGFGLVITSILTLVIKLMF